MLERSIQQAIRIALGRRDDVVLFRNPIGISRHDRRVQRFGLAVGSSDLIGIVRLDSGIGRFLALEVKTPSGRVSAPQSQFLQLVRRFGGFSAVCRSVDEAYRAVNDCAAGVP